MLVILQNWIVNATLWDATLIFLTIFIFVFFLLSVGLAVYTVLLRLINIHRMQRWRVLESRWENQLLDILSGVGSVDDLNALVKKKDRLYFIDFLQRYARLLKGNEVVILKGLAHPFLPLIQIRLKARDAERRARAVQTLSLLGLKSYIEDIIQALDDPSPLVAMVAARSLANPDQPELIQPVLERLHRFENWSQAYLTSMLVSVGPSIIPQLRNDLANPQIPEDVRTIICDALKNFNDFPSADIADSILTQSAGLELTAACLRLLSRTGRPCHLLNIRRLTDSPDDVIRIQAIRALGHLGDSNDRPSLAKAVLDASPWVALQAAKGLLETGGMEELKEIAASRHDRAILAQQVLLEENI